MLQDVFHVICTLGGSDGTDHRISVLDYAQASGIISQGLLLARKDFRRLGAEVKAGNYITHEAS
jgi:hypothetical protein